MFHALANLVARINAARRTDEPRDPDERRIGYTGRTLAGVLVTADTAITVPAVWACLRYLSQTVAQLPWHVMRETVSRSGARTCEVARSHPIDYLLSKRPNPEWSAFQFRETLTHWALRGGNGYAEIERDQLGRPFNLWPIHFSRVDPERDPDTGALVFEVSNGSGKPKTIIAAADMFHLRGFGDGPIGLNVMEYAAESIGWARAAQLFGAGFFGNGMSIAGVVTAKKGLNDSGFKRLRMELQQLYKGPRNAMRTAILDNEMDWKQVQVEPNKGQFLETNQHLVEEVCRWFGVPPHKVQHLLRATFSNIEHQAIEVVVDSVMPWVKRFEEEADYKLFGQNRSGFYTKMNLRALLRGDFKSQQEGLEIMRRAGVLNGNEWRELLDMNPMGPDGDKYTMQSQYTTLARIGEEPAAAPAPAGGRRTVPDEEAEIDEDAAAAAMLDALIEREHAHV